MSEDYIPRAGDLVSFPGAPLERNRTRTYVITNVDIVMLSGVTGGRVGFRADTDTHVYSKPLHELRAIGMRLVMSVDALDPTKED